MANKRSRGDESDYAIDEALHLLEGSIERGAEHQLRVGAAPPRLQPARTLATSHYKNSVSIGTLPLTDLGLLPPPLAVLVPQALDRVIDLVDPADAQYAAQRALVAGDAAFFITELLVDTQVSCC